MNKKKWNEIDIPRMNTERVLVTFNLEKNVLEHFNDHARLYGHGGKRRLMEYIIKKGIESIDFERLEV